jgi:uncharacterized membrane protein YkvA (DUF1232 family)
LAFLASRIGEQLSQHLAEVPLFEFGKQTPSRLKRTLERWSKHLTIRSIVKLVVHRKRVNATLQEIPVRMQRVTNQVRLVLELIDDFAEGTYRNVPWHSMAVAAGAILYSVSPTDIVPDVLPLVGSLDDLFVIGLALKLIEKDLRTYAASKGYDVDDYFPGAASATLEEAALPTRPERPPREPNEARLAGEDRGNDEIAR